MIVTCAYGQIVPKGVLDIPRLGCINVHASLLPKYRGGAPIQHAIMNGEKETGITIHYINEHYDEGAIIFQASCPVLPSDTPDEVAAKVHALEYAHYPHVIESLL